jgi:signal transduction histidine kinase
MSPVLSSHEPLLINTIGYSTGVLLFGLSLYFLVRYHGASRLSIAAAALALLYNLTSLLVLAYRHEALLAISTSALGVLPAVLLHVSLRERFPWIVRAGYVLGGVSVLLHATEQVTGFPHRSATLIATVGFAALTVATGIGLIRAREPMSRITGAMALFLFSMTFVHLGAGEPHSQWTLEMAAHHAGVPLALMVLLQDYRFLLLDAYLRVLASLLLAVVFIAAAEQIRYRTTGDPLQQGLYAVGSAVLLVVYGAIGVRLQRGLTRILFGRPSIENALARLREHAAATQDENVFFANAAREIADYMNAVAAGDPGSAEATAAVRLSDGTRREIALGPRLGGRRYLSEDLQTLERLGMQVAEHMEQFRRAEMSRLVAQAELRALESQIHPHFLFNALNTLYGVIPKEAAGARRMVLNLADILRYCLRAGETFTTLENELRVVEAYLEIEKLRLGERLTVEMAIDECVGEVRIPVLSLQSLVENAIKHAIATQPAGGRLTISATACGDSVAVRVSDSGPGFGESGDTTGEGVGLRNVTRRLQLCYGGSAGLRIESGASGTSAGFDVPWNRGSHEGAHR